MARKTIWIGYEFWWNTTEIVCAFRTKAAALRWKRRRTKAQVAKGYWQRDIQEVKVK